MITIHCTTCGGIVFGTIDGIYRPRMCSCQRTQTITSTSTIKDCEHFNGFWKRIAFKKWIFSFDKRFYVCTDCKDVFTNDYIVRFWKNIIKQNGK